MSIIPLEIAMDYPVEWNFEKILRDLIQNFYDSIGYKNFDSEFIYSWSKNSDGNIDLEMKTFGRPFDYQWLIYIGGSTKTDSPGRYIGMYGEGFKVCMLNLLRAGNYKVIMESSDWKLTPCAYSKELDGQNIEMLAYDMQKRIDDEWTRLTLKNVPYKYIRQIEEAKLNFFYPENPLIGREICTSDTYSIYKRSEMKIPCEKPAYNYKGILFCNFLARAPLEFSLIILVKKNMKESDERDRELLFREKVKEIVMEVFEELQAEEAYEVLNIMKSYWNDIPKCAIDINTWYYAICELVRRISSSNEVTEKFLRDNNDLVYIERKKSDKRVNKIIDETKAWYRQNEKGTLVNPIFRLLGAKSLMDEYMEECLSAFVKPSEKEKNRIYLLMELLEQITPIKLYDDRPEILLRRCKKQNRKPLWFSERIYCHSKTSKRKYKINVIVLEHEDFEDGEFYKTLMKFIDILVYAFGTAKSEVTNIILTEFGAVLIDYRGKIAEYEERWNAGK